jgi:hypothetical protein
MAMLAVTVVWVVEMVLYLKILSDSHNKVKKSWKSKTLKRKILKINLEKEKIGKIRSQLLRLLRLDLRRKEKLSKESLNLLTMIKLNYISLILLKLKAKLKLLHFLEAGLLLHPTESSIL